MSLSLRSVVALALSAGLGVSLLLLRTSARGQGAAAHVDPAGPTLGDVSSHGAGHLPDRVARASCENTPGAKPSGTHAMGDPRARAGAQHGLAFVADNALAWQSEHKCYGCHVQAVTLEALTVGRHNQYDVPQAQIDAILHGMLDLTGGAHGQSGLSFGGGLLEPAKAFGGAAFAHYDAAIDGRVQPELLKVAGELLELQAKDGHVGDYSNGPVAVGPLQTTTQSLQTWRQAYERTADERWLAPMRRAEDYLQSLAKTLTDQPNADMEQLDYAIIGLVSAGASRSEAVVQSLARTLLAAQTSDGAWTATKGAAPSPLVTGATLYALRLTGLGDDDSAVAKGSSWLLAKQAQDGGWSHGGSARGEAMWAVLGLVSIDVLRVDVSGVDEGQRVQGTTAIHALASDNGGGAVQRLDLAVDDVPLKSVCADSLDFALDSAWLGDGPHTVDVTATNAAGRSSRRRVGLYAGAYYLTGVGTRFEDNGTTFALRDLAPRDLKSKVELHVYATRLDQGVRLRGDEVFQSSQDGAQGPLHFFWDGKTTAGKGAAGGAYLAELRFVDAKGTVVQHVETPFVQETMEAERARYGEVSGDLKADGAGALGNAKVDLLDERGNVVQSVNTTAQGNYDFHGVARGNYHVRVQKDGFAASEQAVSAAPAAMSKAPMKLIAK